MPKSIEQKKRELQARRETEARKHQMRVALTEKSIAECEAEIEKAKTIIENKAYGTIGNYLLGVAMFFSLGGAVSYMIGMADYALIAWIIAGAILAGSLFMNTRPLFAEERLRRNMVILKKKRAALSELKNRH